MTCGRRASQVQIESIQARGGNTNKYLPGAHPKISQMHRLYTHNCTYNLDYILNNLDKISNYLDSGVSQDTGERSHRENSGRKLGLGLTSQSNLDYIQKNCRLFEL